MGTALTQKTQDRESLLHEAEKKAKKRKMVRNERRSGGWKREKTKKQGKRDVEGPEVAAEGGGGWRYRRLTLPPRPTRPN